LPGLFVLGEANFSDHGANLLGASALMQGLADGYFVLPYTIGDYLAKTSPKGENSAEPEFKKCETESAEKINRLLSINGKRTIDEFHRELGKLLWNKCGMTRSENGLKEALAKIPQIREEFWKNVKVTGTGEEFNQALERAGRVADFLEFGELMVTDALHRRESCGGHFRQEFQTPEGEALRDDQNFTYAAAWEFKGVGTPPVLYKEDLKFEEVQLTQRSYK
ncbi:MAG TPA: fumarate reductase/succinate dehydrogenase flavoprotein subunit, partial [Candidatus Omnitrophota bacterium]|nr:fumarate reductase/succinate dehydrogenase flavoprotein subunit [Candidatus Omnitrophota bacterium]